MRRRRLPASLLVAALVVWPLACADDADDSGGSATGEEAAPDETASGDPRLPPFDPLQELPPNDVGALRRLYDPMFESMGLRLTRAALVDTTDGQYEQSNDGTHLALYVEPTGAYSNEQYVEGLWTVSAVVTPDVFARWSGLESYDICQEPPPDVDDRPEPFPATQINITREDAATIDWAGGDLVDLLVAAKQNPEVRLIVNRQVRATSTYEAADAAARTRLASQRADS
jgi:hypothetical protein